MFYLSYNINKHLIMNKTVLIILLFKRKKITLHAHALIKDKSVFYYQ